MPEVQAQPLRRDDWIWQQHHGARTPNSPEDEVRMGILIPGVNTLRENGATLVS